MANDEMNKETKKKKKGRFLTGNTEAATVDVDLDQSSYRVAQNKDKKHKKNNNYGEEEIERKNNLITDARFASAQSDPRFQRIPKREAKVPIDSRFVRMLSDRRFTSSEAAVDKRGKPRKGHMVNPLLHYYLHEKDPEEDAVVEREVEENGDKVSTSSDEDTDASSSTTDDENDDDVSFFKAFGTYVLRIR